MGREVAWEKDSGGKKKGILTDAARKSVKKGRRFIPYEEDRGGDTEGKKV